MKTIINKKDIIIKKPYGSSMDDKITISTFNPKYLWVGIENKGYFKTFIFTKNQAIVIAKMIHKNYASK